MSSSATSSACSTSSVRYQDLPVQTRYTHSSTSPQLCVFLFPCCSAHVGWYFQYFPSLSLVTDRELLREHAAFETRSKMQSQILILAHGDGVMDALFYCHQHRIKPMRIIAISPPHNPNQTRQQLLLMHSNVTAFWTRSDGLEEKEKQESWYNGGVMYYDERTVDPFRYKHLRDAIVFYLMGGDSRAYAWCTLSNFQPPSPYPTPAAKPADDSEAEPSQFVPFTPASLQQFRSFAPKMNRYDDLLFALEWLYHWPYSAVFMSTVLSVYSHVREMFDKTYQRQYFEKKERQWQDVDCDDEGFSEYLQLLHSDEHFYPILHPMPAARLRITESHGAAEAALHASFMRLTDTANTLALMVLYPAPAPAPPTQKKVFQSSIRVIKQHSLKPLFIARVPSCSCWARRHHIVKAIPSPTREAIQSDDEDDLLAHETWKSRRSSNDDDDDDGEDVHNKENIPPSSTATTGRGISVEDEELIAVVKRLYDSPRERYDAWQISRDKREAERRISTGCVPMYITYYGSTFTELVRMMADAGVTMQLES